MAKRERNGRSVERLYPFKFPGRNSCHTKMAEAIAHADGQWGNTPWEKIDYIDRVWYTRLAQAAAVPITLWFMKHYGVRSKAKKAAKRKGRK